MAYAFASASSQYIKGASVPRQTRPITIAYWLYRENTATTQGLVEISNSARNSLFYCFLVDSSGMKHRTIVNVIDSQNVATTTGSWLAGAGAFSTTTVQAWLSGSPAASFNDSNTVSTSFFTIGANKTPAEYLNGRLCEIGIWSVELSSDDIQSLNKGFSARRVRPQSLVFYAPMIRDLTDIRGGIALTNNGATVADHPRVY